MYVPSPEAPNGRKEVGFFAHIDRGELYVDHHSFFMSSNPTGHVHHCSFEVHDFDTQLLGHKYELQIYLFRVSGSGLLTLYVDGLRKRGISQSGALDDMFSDRRFSIIGGIRRDL